MDDKYTFNKVEVCNPEVMNIPSVNLSTYHMDMIDHNIYISLWRTVQFDTKYIWMA